MVNIRCCCSSVADDVSPDARAGQTASVAAAATAAESGDDGARSNGTVSGEPRTGHAAQYDGENVKRYSYAGPPKINVSTWNERPKRQVSIKTDRDYVIGIRQRLQLRHQQRDTDDDDDDDDDNGKPATAMVSRVPIVKSVELKKPYAERLQLRTDVGPALALSEAIRAQAKLSDGCYGPYRRGGVVRKLDGGRRLAAMPAHVDPRETLLESIRSFGGRDNLRKIRA